MAYENTFDYNGEVSKINGIQFGIMSPEEIRQQSVVEVTTHETFNGNEPVVGGLFDPRMGIFEYGQKCATDMLPFKECPGYFGHINLAAPVFSVQYFGMVQKILKCVCFRCSKVLYQPDEEELSTVLAMSTRLRFPHVLEICKKAKKCKYCDSTQPEKYVKTDFCKVHAEWKAVGEGEATKLQMTPEYVLRLFQRIDSDSCKLLGFNPDLCHPSWMICQVFPVCPPACRPSVKQDNGQRMEDDLTIKYCDIIKYNKLLADKIESGVTGKILEDWRAVVQYHVATLIDNEINGILPAAQRSGRPLKALRQRLKAKEGRIRGNLMGKRVDFSSRTVITPDPIIDLDELGVPERIAMILTYPEKVNEKNIGFLKKCIRNGPEKIPGARSVFKKDAKRTISLNHIDRNQVASMINIGDIVIRHIKDGDRVLFNRQPSLHKMSMMAHKIRVLPGLTFRLNVSATTPYNADFDGDEMNMHVPQTIATANELECLAAIQRQIVSPAQNSPIITFVQDSVVGSYVMTQNDKAFTHSEMMNVLSWNNSFHGNLKYKKFYSGREALSFALPNISLSIKNKADEKVIIENGQILQGTFDKKVFGKIIHIIFRDYGPSSCLQFFNNAQHIIRSYLNKNMFSVGLNDLILSDELQTKIDENIRQKVLEVDNTIQRVHLNMFENLSSDSNKEAFESKVHNTLRGARSASENILSKEMKEFVKTNRFMSMVNSGSKGKLMNLAQMTACLGPQDIDGKRAPYGFDNRTLPHFPKYSVDAHSRGFVHGSFKRGLNPLEYFFHAMGGREGLIDTAVKSVSWDTDIFIIENDEMKHIPIGNWVDGHLDNPDNKENVEKYEERNLELLKTKEVYVPTTDKKGNVTWEEVTAVTRHDPGTKLYKIKTNFGREVIVTENKSILVWNYRTRSLEETYPELILDPKNAFYVPVTHNLPEFKHVKRSIDMRRYMKDTYPKPETNKKIDISEDYASDEDDHLHFPLNRKNCRFLGIFMGVNYSIKKDKDPKILAQLEDWLERSEKYSEFFEYLKKNPDEIPLELILADANVINEFLFGMFSISGTTKNNSLFFMAKYKIFGDFISMLCSRTYAKEFVVRKKMHDEELGDVYMLILCKDIKPPDFGFENDIVLDRIQSVEVIGVEEHPKMYDLTIPKTLNFGLANGLQVRDTSSTGYIQRKLMKALEDMIVSWSGAVKDSFGNVVQFSYGDDSVDGASIEFQNIPVVDMNPAQIHTHFGYDEYMKECTSDKKNLDSWNEILKDLCHEIIEKREYYIKDICNNAPENSIRSAIHIQRILSNYEVNPNVMSNLNVEYILEKYEKLIDAMKANKFNTGTWMFRFLLLNHADPKTIICRKRMSVDDFDHFIMTLMNTFEVTRVEPGESVGPIAAQSLGEITTQLTLNSVPYDTEIIVRNSKGHMEQFQIGDFVEKKINANKENLTYYEDKDTTYSPLKSDDFYEIHSVNEAGEMSWEKIEAVTKHPVVNEDGSDILLKITTKNCREVTGTKAKAFLQLIDGKVQEVNGDKLKVGQHLVVSRKQIEYTEREFLDMKELFSPSEYIYQSEVEKALKVMDEQFWWSKYSLSGKARKVLPTTKKPRVIERGDEEKCFMLPHGRSDCFRDFVKRDLHKGLKENCVYMKEANVKVSHFPEKFPLDYEFGYVMGAYYAEGCTTKFQVSISNNDMDFLKPICDWCEKYNITYKIYRHEDKNQEGWTSQDIRIYSKLFRDMLIKFGGGLSHLKKVHPLLTFSNKEFVLGFLNGYISGDGTVHCEKAKFISVGSTSKELLIDVETMLNTLNVNANIRKCKRQTSNNRGTLPEKIQQPYELRLSVNESQKLSRLLKLTIKKKQDNLEVLKVYNPQKVKNKVPDIVNGEVVWEETDRLPELEFDEIVSIEEVHANGKVFDLTIANTRTFMIRNFTLVFDTFHQSGMNSKTVTRGVPRLQELFHLSKNPKSPSMTVYLKSPYISDKHLTQKIGYEIERTLLKDLVIETSIYYDPDDSSTKIPGIDQELLNFYKSYEDRLIDKEETKSNWVLRFTFDKKKMLSKDLEMEDIYFAIRSVYKQDIQCIFTDDNSPELIMRIRLFKLLDQKKMDQSVDHVLLLKDIENNMLNDVVIKGIHNIHNAILRSDDHTRGVIRKNGDFEKVKEWILDTNGSNMLDVLTHPAVDQTRLVTNDIYETYAVLGIEATRAVLINEISDVFEDASNVDKRHVQLLVDMMTTRGTLLSIDRNGMKLAPTGPLAKCSFEEADQQLYKAAIFGEYDNMSGVSANIMVGQTPPCGTGTVSVELDEDEFSKLVGIAYSKQKSTTKEKSEKTYKKNESRSFTKDMDEYGVEESKDNYCDTIGDDFEDLVG